MKSIVLEELIILRSIQISQNRFDPALNVLSLNNIFFKKWANPGLFKHTLQILQQMGV